MIKLIYFKPTNYCNVGCSHCYLTGKQRSDFYFMDKKDLDIIYDKLENYFKKHFYKSRPYLTLHGGEPLLVSFEILEYFFQKFNEYNISVQTSLFPLFDKSYEERKKYYELFKKYNVKVSTSYDFFGVRKYKRSYEKFDKVFLEIVKELNKENLQPYMMFTITKKMQGKEKEVYEWLLKNYKLFSGISYEEYNEYNTFNRFLYLTNKEIAEMLIKFYELDKENNFKIFPFFKFIKQLIQNNRIMCYSCQEENLVIFPDGNTSSCYTRNGLETFGNIYKQPLEEILRNKKRLEWIILGKNNLEICKDCEFKNICNGGCPLKKSILKKKQKITSKEECSGFYPFLKHILG